MPASPQALRLTIAGLAGKLCPFKSQGPDHTPGFMTMRIFAVFLFLAVAGCGPVPRLPGPESILPSSFDIEARLPRLNHTEDRERDDREKKRG